MMNNRKIIFGFLIVFIISLNIYNIPMKNQEDPRINDVKPVETGVNFDVNKLAVALNSTLNTSHDLNAYDNIIVTFWATWCPSCHRENAVFNDFVKKNNNVFIIGICVDKNKAALKKYVQENKLDFPTVNINKEIAVLFDDVSVVPTHYIINVKKQSVEKTMGLLDKNQLANFVKDKQ